ncbi:MAG TPA: protein kinase, partial [Thermoanaerobaculia bacterium]|nr:protein kinase [Thermoanaerobaculia bacterium]
VKPSNVLLTADGRVKLMDFGIALLIGDKRLTSSQASIGTPIYMSPEQILRPREMDHRTDIYSAAIVFYEMLAGAPPFDAESMYEINKLQIEAPPPDLSARNPAVPPAVTAVVGRALAKNPDDRFASAGEMLRALREAVPVTAPGGATASDPTLPLPAPAGFPRTDPLPPLPRTVAPPPAVPPMPAPAVGSGKRWPLWKVLVPAGVVLALLTAVALGLFLQSSPSPPSAGGVTVAAASPPAAAPSTPEPASPAPAQLSERAPAVPAVDPPMGMVGVGKPARDPAPKGGRAQRAAPPPPVDNREVNKETHRREVALIRETLRKGLDSVRDDVEAKRFSAARELLSQLQETAVPYRADLIDEVANLHALEQKVTSAEISAKTADITNQQDEAAWKRRLQEIRGLIQDKHYPEAQTLANKLASDGGVPEAIAAEARDLGARAEQEMKSIFKGTKVKTKDEVVKKPPR